MFNSQFVASATFVRPITAILIIAVYPVIQGKIAAGWGKSQLQKIFAAPVGAVYELSNRFDSCGEI